VPLAFFSGTRAASTNIMPRYRMTLPLRLLLHAANKLRATRRASAVTFAGVLFRSMAANEKGSSRLSVLSDERFDYGEDLLLLVAW
jgi:hypothetical protein